MNPSGRTKTTTRTRRKVSRRSHLKKKQSQKQQVSTTDFSDEVAAEVSTTCSSCSTPKGAKFRIPEVSTCPPAPKKKPRLLSNNCSLRISPAALFAPPDLEIFFSSVVLPQDVSVSFMC
ncbi:hypothetical protein RIF29_18160 [Crotalaria pallida]|uniref:Uncharacterized protein n=1 Tax=Crotalaria pallida TaxID=3830 RepID=A0AAN9FKP8_CROPI